MGKTIRCWYVKNYFTLQILHFFNYALPFLPLGIPAILQAQYEHHPSYPEDFDTYAFIYILIYGVFYLAFSSKAIIYNNCRLLLSEEGVCLKINKPFLKARKILLSNDMKLVIHEEVAGHKPWSIKYFTIVIYAYEEQFTLRFKGTLWSLRTTQLNELYSSLNEAGLQRLAAPLRKFLIITFC
ncbi:hypothetical protein [Algivirga pacifica]|uniref:YcxB-like protein domain-containing protein n=1 Tax=Algivirga pacifica TaxID=1162670 RepID=A0ABP9D6N5_9BACT